MSVYRQANESAMLLLITAITSLKRLMSQTDQHLHNVFIITANSAMFVTFVTFLPHMVNIFNKKHFLSSTSAFMLFRQRREDSHFTLLLL